MNVRSGRLKAAIANLSGSWVNLVIVSLQAIVLVPLYLKYIGPRLYGAWLGSGDFLIWMQAMDLGLPNLMIQRIGAAQGKNQIDDIVEYFSSGLLALCFLALVLMLIFGGISIWLPNWMQLEGSEVRKLRTSFLIGVFATGLLVINNSAVGLARGIQDTMLINVMVIISSLVSFLVTLLLLLRGWGLISIAVGLFTRALLSISGSMFFVIGYFRFVGVSSLRIRFSVLSEYLNMLPVTGAAGLSYALMNQSESALIAIFIRPEVATIFTLSRKAIGVAKNLVDGIGTAVYGSFAHLVVSKDKYRASSVFIEINSLRLSLGVAFAVAYMIVNRSFVSLWVGESQYGGALLTVLLGIRFIVSGSSYLINYLYRATGEIIRGSLALLIEGFLRVGLTIGLLILFGMQGVPLAGIIVSAIWSIFLYRRVTKKLDTFSAGDYSPSAKVWIVRLVILCVGVVMAFLTFGHSWIFVLSVGALVTIGGSIGLILIDSRLTITRSTLCKIFSWLRMIVSGG